MGDPTRACPCFVGCLCCPFVMANHNELWAAMREVKHDGAPHPRNDSCACGYPWSCCEDTACCPGARLWPCALHGYPCGWSSVFGLPDVDLNVFSPRDAGDE